MMPGMMSRIMPNATPRPSRMITPIIGRKRENATPKDSPTEPFKRAVAGCLRAIARKHDLDVTFAAGFSSQEALAARLGFDRSVIGKAETGDVIYPYEKAKM